MRLTLAIPHLLSVDPAQLSRLPGLGRLAAFAGAPRAYAAGIDAAFAAATGMPPDTSLARLAAAGASFEPGDACVLYADPVALVAGRDDVLLAGRVDDLCEADTRALVAALNSHFATDGIVFHAPRPDTWFLTAESARGLVTTPLPAVRGAIHANLPRSDPQFPWRRWLAEMQMLMHEHPVNAARASAGLVPATGLWLWGNGNQTRGAPRDDTGWFAATGRTGDVARGIAWWHHDSAALPPGNLGLLPPSAAAHVMFPPVIDAVDAQGIDRAWFTPAADALARGTITELILVSDRVATAYVWRAQQPPWMTRVRLRWAAPPFTIPAADEDA